jgi:hypothetical protein
MRSSLDNGRRVESIGRRPRNSGIRPYCCRSGDVRPLRGVGSWSAESGLAGFGSGAPNPIDYSVSLNSVLKGQTYPLAKTALDYTLQSDERARQDEQDIASIDNECLALPTCASAPTAAESR